MPSTEIAASLEFAATRETLEAVVARLGDGEARRAAFAAYLAMRVPGPRPGRGWKHDYDAPRFEGLRWSTGTMDLPTMPWREEPASVDGPALATENAGGLAHIGALAVRAADGGRVDPRITVRPFDVGDLAAPAPLAPWRTDRFAALAYAFRNCGAYVNVPDGVVLDAPIQLVFVNGEGEAAAVFPHIIVVLGRNARATVIERHLAESGEAFISAIVEAHVGDGAQLEYAVVQRASDEARVFANRVVRCGKDAVARVHLAELGGTLARSVVGARLDNPGARAEISALFFNTGMQHVELVTETEHVVSNTTSDTVVRTAAADRGQGRFFGNIAIRPHAHGSDASLRDDALLLAKRAHIDSVPALEIGANDVKAFHGATVGSLDEEQLFYAGSRGIARHDAVRMVALAFFEPAVSRFPGDTLRDEVRTALDGAIDEATEIDA